MDEKKVDKSDMDLQIMTLRDALNNHIGRSDVQFKKMDSQFDDMHGHLNRHIAQTDEMKTYIMKSIDDNAQTSTNIKESVEGIVEWSENLKGAYRVGDGVQKFMLWLLKWGFIGGALATGIAFVIKHFSKVP